MITDKQPTKIQFEIDKNSVCPLARLEVEWNSWEDKTLTTEWAIRILKRHIKHGRQNYMSWLFFDSGWIGNNRITRHKGYWKSIAKFGIPNFDNIERIEMSEEREDKIKFLCALPCDDFDEGLLANIVRSSPYESQLFVIDKDIVQTVLECLNGRCLHHSLGRVADDTIGLLCKFNMLAFQADGWFDDRNSGGAYLGREEIINGIATT